jgi:hypothetical protein
MSPHDRASRSWRSKKLRFSTKKLTYARTPLAAA